MIENKSSKNKPSPNNPNSPKYPTLGKRPFHLLTKYLIRVKAIRKPTKKMEFTSKFFSQILFKDIPCRKDAFLVLRFLLPQIDRERPNYQLKEKKLAVLISKALALSKHETDRLKHYKNPMYHTNTEHGVVVGDFVLVMRDVIKDYLRKSADLKSENSLNLEELDNLFGKLGKVAALNRGDIVAGGYQKLTIKGGEDEKLKKGEKTESQVQIMATLLKKSSIDDFEWICRIILKDLKCGLKQEKILRLFHPDALKVFNTVSNLRDVCRECLDPNQIVEKCIFRLFTPLRPYLAKRVNPDKIQALFNGQKFYIEEKFDGERIQLHFDENEMKFFSRNCFDATTLYLPHFESIIR